MSQKVAFICWLALGLITCCSLAIWRSIPIRSGVKNCCGMAEWGGTVLQADRKGKKHPKARVDLLYLSSLNRNKSPAIFRWRRMLLDPQSTKPYGWWSWKSSTVPQAQVSGLKICMAARQIISFVFGSPNGSAWCRFKQGHFTERQSSSND